MNEIRRGEEYQIGKEFEESQQCNMKSVQTADLADEEKLGKQAIKKSGGGIYKIFEFSDVISILIWLLSILFIHSLRYYVS